MNPAHLNLEDGSATVRRDHIRILGHRLSPTLMQIN
jgi:hypothetical protein